MIKTISNLIIGLSLLSGQAMGDSITYYKDIKPIMDASCASCHGVDRVAFPMANYDTVFAMRYGIRSAIQSGRMPIWLPAPGHREYLDDLSLTSDEKATFDNWFQAGFPAGDPTDETVVDPKVIDIKPNLVIPLLGENESYLPDQENKDDYRCFIKEWPMQELTYIKGIQSKPGNLRVAHHAVVYIVKPEVATALRYLDESEEGMGYQCFSGAFPDRLGDTEVQEDLKKKFPGVLEKFNTADYFIGGWAPGTGGYIYPDNTGFPVEPGSLFVVQMHYYSAFAPGERDADTETWLITSKSVSDSGTVLSITDRNWLAPGEDNTMSIPPFSNKEFKVSVNLLDLFKAREEYIGAEKPLDSLTIYSANLHMHDYGASAMTYLQNNGEREVMLEIPEWDLNWQTNFNFKKPIVINRKDAGSIDLVVECSFSNPNDYTVVGGFGSDDEMCFNFSYGVYR